MMRSLLLLAVVLAPLAALAEELAPAPAEPAPAPVAAPVAAEEPEAAPAPQVIAALHALAPAAERDDPLSPASLLSRDLNEAGNVLVRWLRPDGAIVVREVSPAGEILGEAADGSVLDLPALGAERYPDGRIGLLVRDAYGAMLRFALGADGGAGEAVIVEDAPGL